MYSPGYWHAVRGAERCRRVQAPKAAAVGNGGPRPSSRREGGRAHLEALLLHLLVGGEGLEEGKPHDGLPGCTGVQAMVRVPAHSIVVRATARVSAVPHAAAEVACTSKKPSNGSCVSCACTLFLDCSSMVAIRD